MAVIVYVVGKTPTIAAFERFFTFQWNFIAKPTIYLHNDGYFVVKFVVMEDKDVVLYSGPYTMNSKPDVVKMWNADFDFTNEVLKTIPLWIQLPKLPLNCWEDDSLSRIGSTLGVLIYVDACTTKVERISYARILVKIDVTRPLPIQIMVEDPNGREFEQEIWYDWMPMYCNKYLQLDHMCQESQKKALPKQQKGRNQKPQQFWRKIGHEEGGLQSDQVIQKVAVSHTQVQGMKMKGNENIQQQSLSKSLEMTIEEEGWKTVKNKSISKGAKNMRTQG
ncbi:uncharacterized protein [Nicotiana sylvestris]|uniref:uncharacterized protein n=1 Tax=Nicotiana sylvestris TaxID=4096 RepID=UPI00388C5C3C